MSGRFHNEELYSLYRTPKIVRVIKFIKLRWEGHVARIIEGRSAFKILIGKTTGSKPLGRPRRRLEDNTGMHIKEIGIGTRNWVDSAQDRYYWRALVNLYTLPKSLSLLLLLLELPCIPLMATLGDFFFIFNGPHTHNRDTI